MDLSNFWQTHLGVREPQAFEISVGTDPTALADHAGELVCF